MIQKIKAVAADLQLDITEECIALLNTEPRPVVVAGSSGGKDSDALVILLDQFLKRIDYPGERVIVHADLGRIEHAESIDQVRALSKFVGWPLIVTRREKGDLLDRYEQRWHDNCRRYALLECVTLIGPYPSFLSPFCRSESKIAPIIQTITKRFPGQTILSCVGLRAEESSARAKKRIFQSNPKFTRSAGTRGFDWHPIHNTSIERVFLIHKQFGFPLHIQYSRGNQRLSCSCCFLASKNDLRCGAAVETNHFAYRAIIDLEIRSSFSYQADNWLADIAPELLNTEQRQAVVAAKAKASDRRMAEASFITPELLFKNHGGRRGWPASQPSLNQCEQLAKARNAIAQLFGDEIERTTNLEIRYLTASSIYDRYAQLLAERPPQLADSPLPPLFQTASMPIQASVA